VFAELRDFDAVLWFIPPTLAESFVPELIIAESILPTLTEYCY
jgi:hypothetical protein